METPSRRTGVGLSDVAFGLLCLVSVATVLVGQFVSLVAFDTTGLDRYVPGLVVYSLVPAALVTAAPALVAGRRYGRRRALALSAGVFLAALVVSLFSLSFFVLG